MDTQGRLCGVVKEGGGSIPISQYQKAMEVVFFFTKSLAIIPRFFFLFDSYAVKWLDQF